MTDPSIDNLTNIFSNLNTDDKKEVTNEIKKVSNDKKEILDNKTINDKFKKIIDDSIYVKNCVSNKDKSYYSLSSLIDTKYVISKEDNKLGQSDCIKLGCGNEKILTNFIISEGSHLKNIKKPNIKDVKEKV